MVETSSRPGRWPGLTMGAVDPTDAADGVDETSRVRGPATEPSKVASQMARAPVRMTVAALPTQTLARRHHGRALPAVAPLAADCCIASAGSPGAASAVWAPASFSSAAAPSARRGASWRRGEAIPPSSVFAPFGVVDLVMVCYLLRVSGRTRTTARLACSAVHTAESMSGVRENYAPCR